MIPISFPSFGAKEQEALLYCLESSWVSTAAPQVQEFEEAIAEMTGAAEVVALSSGTAALHLAMLEAGIGPGDEVLVPDLTFIASANAVSYTGARPVLVDVEVQSWMMDIGLAGRYLRNEGHRVKAILLVHLLGYAADVQAWQALAEAHGLLLLEDAAGAIGTLVESQHAGTFGDAGILSFNGNKLVTTGGGGAVLCRDARQATRIRHLAHQAKIQGAAYDHSAIGYNYGMTGLSAALGLAQLARLPEFLHKQAQLFDFYQQHFPEARFPVALPHSSPNHWLVTARLQNRDYWQERLTEAGIQTRPIWTPLHLQAPYQEHLFLSKHNHSGEIWQEALSFPSGTGLAKAQQDAISEVILNAR